MGYASCMCLVALIANLPIYTIFDTYFTFYFWPKVKNYYYFGGQNSLEIFQNWTAWSPTHVKSMYNHCWSRPPIFLCTPFQIFQKYRTAKMALYIFEYSHGGTWAMQNDDLCTLLSIRISYFIIHVLSVLRPHIS